MMWSHSYRNACIAAIILHLLIIVMLLWESSSNKPPVLVQSMQNKADIVPEIASVQSQAIKAVSIDSKELMNAVNRLKDARADARQAEEKKQMKLSQEAALMRRQRVNEERRLDKLKQESVKLNVAHKKALETEQLHLKQLAQQKAEEEKHLAVIKKQRMELEQKQVAEEQALSKKIAELKKTTEINKAAELKHVAELKKTAELKQAAEILRTQEAAKDELRRAKQAAVRQAALDTQKNAQMSGEVNKYKALIIGAIGREWILPENANNKASSQFRIRLAPNGLVLEVSLIRSSGDAILDRSAQSAIYKASPLPVPQDPVAFNMFRDISLTVRPENSRG